MSDSRLGALCTQVVEAGWLTASVVTPLFFNVYSRRAFEADKLLLLRSIAIIMALAWIIKWIEQYGSREYKFASSLRRPFVLPTVILIGVLIVTTITSIVPRISFFGSYTRLEGTFTILCYVLIFFLVILELRTKRQLDRLVLTIILTSVPVALYAWIQNFGFDPFGGQFSIGSERVFADIGNPIYLAAYMVMVWCLTIGKLGAALHANEGKSRFTVSSLVWIFCFGLIIAVQTGAIFFAGSRGPFLGWLTGLALFVLLLALAWRRKAIIFGVISMGLLGAVFLVIVNVPGSPLARMRSAVDLGRLVDLSPVGTAQVRLAIWEGSTNLVLPHPPIQFPDGSTDPLNAIRPLVGYGPDSMYLVFGQYFPSSLVSDVYPGNTAVGRSHNETWDFLVTSGVLGLLAYQFLFFEIFLNGLRWLGMAPARSHRLVFAGLWFGLAAASGLATLVLGQPKYLGIALAAGGVCAIFVYLAVCAISLVISKSEVGSPRSDQILIAALLAAMLSHYVETQFSFSVAATYVLFWAFAGMLAVIGARQFDAQTVRSDQATSESQAAPEPSDSAPPISSWVSNVISYGLIVALILTTILYEFVTDNERIVDPIRILWNSLTMDVQRTGTCLAVLGMALFVMALTSLIIGSEMVRNRELKSTMSVLGALAIFTPLGLGIALTFGLGFAARVGEMMTVRLMQADDVLNMSSHQMGLLDYYSIYVFLLLLLVAVILTAERKQLPTAWFARKLSLCVLVPGIFVASQLINTYNLDLIRADTIYSLGQKFDGFREWDFTFALYQRAISKAPNEDVYFRGLGATFLGRAISLDSTTPSTGSRFDEQTPVQTILGLDVQHTADLSQIDLLNASQSVFMRGRQINPLNADHTVGLAQVYQYRSTLTDDATQKARLIGLLSEYFAQATRLTPRDAALIAAWAKLRDR